MIHWFEIAGNEMQLYRHVSHKYEFAEEKIVSLPQPGTKKTTWLVMFRKRLDMEQAEMIWHMVKDEEKEILNTVRFAD